MVNEAKGRRHATFGKCVFLFSRNIVLINSRIHLLQILVFLQVFIDTNFVVLLQDQRSRVFLKTLHACLNPQINITMDLEDLRGPLEPFVNAQTRALNPDAASKASAERRSRQTLQQANAGVKPYQIEEIWL